MSLRFAAGGLALALPFVFAPALAADDPGIARMATCRDSWFDWQNKDPARLKAFGDRFRASFVPKGDEGYFVPKTDATVAGLNVLRVYPGSVGMGVGFSLFVDAGFDKTRDALARLTGKRLDKCETGDGMHSCELEIGPKRTFMLMADDNPKSHRTLIGCYYFYEK